MRVSVSAKTEGVPLKMMMFQGDLEDSLRTAAELGYDGVELFLFAAESDEAERAKRLLKKYRLGVGMVVALFDMITNDIVMGHPDAAVRQQFLDRAPHHLKLAAAVGGRVPVGFTRGYVRPGTTEADIEGWFVEALHKYVRMAENEGVTLVLEPINRYEINYINTTAQALRILDQVQSPNLKLLLDTFHMNIEEVSITRAIRSAGDNIGHVHFVDSNRWPPGYGHTNLKEVYDELRTIGYGGFLGIEALPMPSPEEGARTGLQYLRTLERLYDQPGAL